MRQLPPGRSLLAGGRNWPLVLAAIVVILCVAALASIWLGGPHSRRAKIVWTIVTIVLPIIGPRAWFALAVERKR